MASWGKAKALLLGGKASRSRLAVNGYTSVSEIKTKLRQGRRGRIVNYKGEGTVMMK